MTIRKKTAVTPQAGPSLTAQAPQSLINPRPRNRRKSVSAGSAVNEPGAPASPSGAAKQIKRRATGDYEVGYCKPPAQHRFKPNNGGGPGRPRGSRSQDSYLREDLDEIQAVQMGGRMRKIPKRRLANKILINKSLEKQDVKGLEAVIAHATRLFPERAETNAGASDDVAANDAVILRTLIASMQLGVAQPGDVDPLADAFTPTSCTEPEPGDGGWAEGDWHAPCDITDEETGDEN